MLSLVLLNAQEIYEEKNIYAKQKFIDDQTSTQTKPSAIKNLPSCQKEQREDSVVPHRTNHVSGSIARKSNRNLRFYISFYVLTIRRTKKQIR